MYLKVQYNNSIKDYKLTDSYNKPYIKVSNSILPLTTNTTNGIHIKINHNNTTYRPLEYNSMSTSNTYYTSVVNSNGLSSTTALTSIKANNISTIYHTDTYINNVSTYSYTPGRTAYRSYSCLINATFFVSSYLHSSTGYTYSTYTRYTITHYMTGSMTRTAYYTTSSSNGSSRTAESSITTDIAIITFLYQITSSNTNITSTIDITKTDLIRISTSEIMSCTKSIAQAKGYAHETVYSVIDPINATIETYGYSGVSSSSSQSSGWL